MEWTYTTKQDDTWDVLALDIYGTEMLAGHLQAANPEYLHLLFFPAGIELVVPDTPKQATAVPGAPWKRGEYLSSRVGTS